MANDPIPHSVEDLARLAVDAAFQVHSALEPGLLESVYEDCLAYELSSRGARCERQKVLPVIYKDRRIEGGYRVDLLIDDALIVELKAVEVLLPVHEVQLLTYLKLSRRRLGLLINFNVPLNKQGIRRIVN